MLFALFLFSCVLYPRWGIFGDKSRSSVVDSYPEAGQTDQVNKDKEKDKLRLVFPVIDTNGDGQISVQELASRTEMSMKAFYRQEAATRSKELDTNGDGKVTWEEYTNEAEKSGAFTEQQRKRDKRRFSFADLNKNGWLSSDELLSVFHPEENPHMFAVIVEEFMEFADSDRDGYLSFDEYKVTTVDSGETNLRSVDKSFKRLDNDQDGRLDKDETKLWLSAISTISQAKNQAQRQVKMADDNKDGVLSQEEMLRHILLFTTGSQKHKSQGSVKNEL